MPLPAPAAPAGYHFVLDNAGTGAVPRQLGVAGTFGTVFLARSEALGHLVAIKFVPVDATNGWRALTPELVRREASAQSELNHEHVVRVYDLVATDDHLAIVMEYVSGGSLATLPDRIDLTANAAWRLLIETARGLAYLHERSLTHRDVKPANVLVTSTGTAKLADLGLVATTDAQHDPLAAELRDRVVGSPRYSSPEQAAGAWPTPASDVFSFAVLAHELLTGSVPTPDDADDRAVPATGFGRRIDHALAACLRRTPAERPADGTALVELLVDAGEHHLPDWSTSAFAVPDTARDDPPAAAVVPDDATRAPGHPEPPSRGPLVARRALPIGPPPRPALERYEPRQRRRTRRLMAVALVSLATGVLLGVGAVFVQRLRRGDPPRTLAIETFTLASTIESTDCPTWTVRVRGLIRTNGAHGTLRLIWRLPDGRDLVAEEVSVSPAQREVAPQLVYPLSMAEGTAQVALHITAPLDVWSEPVTLPSACT